MLSEEKRKQLDGIVREMINKNEPDSNVQFVVDDFRKKYDAPIQQEPSKENIPFVPKLLEPIVRGTAKVGEFLGLKPLGTSIAEIISGAPQTFKPKQIVGSALQAGLLATPLGLPKTLLGKTLQFMGVGAGFGVGQALEEDKSVREIAKGAISGGVITGALPVIGKGVATIGKKAVRPIGEVISSILGQFIGKPPEVIKKAFSDPQIVAQAMANQKIPATIRVEAITMLDKLKTESKKAFRTGLEEQQKLHPFGKTGQILVKKEFGNIKDNISNLLRQHRVSIQSSGELNFDKLTSAIVSSSERKNVQLVIDTIFQQKNFLPKDVQAVSARLSKLSKYTEGAIPQSSAVIRQIHSIYKKGLEAAYPALGDIRKKFSIERKVYDELDNLLGVGKLKPINITGAIRRLSNVFKEDNELYLEIIQKLEKETGVDILAELAASEFAKLAPSSFGSRVAQAGLLAGGAFINPLILLAIPLFSPKFVGKITTTAGKTAQIIPKIGEKITPLLPKTIPQIIGD